MTRCRFSFPGLLVLVGLTFATISGCGGEPELQGTGSTFIAPLCDRWIWEFSPSHPDFTIEYQGKGSSAGIKDLTEGLVAFAGSDAAMSDAQIAKVDPAKGVVMLPLTAGAIVLAYNLPEVPDLRLSRQAYTGILLGTITRWNDPAIVACNPGRQLPDHAISVVHRAEGSGTTYAFSNHLSAVSKEWQDRRGVNASIKWPRGNFTGAKGNDGVLAQIKQNRNAIGYVEYGYVYQTKSPYAILENKAGKYIVASTTSGQAALAGASMPANLRLFIPDPEGEASYPIVTYSWLLAHRKYGDPATAPRLKEFFRYCAGEGQRFAEQLGYIPLPEAVVGRVLKAIEQIH